MSVIAELTLASSRLTVYQAMTSVPEIEVEIESLEGLNPEQPVFVLWAHGDRLDAFESALEADPTVGDVQRLDSLPERRLYRLEFSADVDVVIYPNLLEVGATLLHLEGQGEEWYARIRFPGREALRSFQTFCDDNDIAFSLDRIYDEPVANSNDGLTAAQEAAIASALEAGYFEVPRDAELGEIAADLGVSEQSVSERIRRGVQTLASRAVRDTDD